MAVDAALAAGVPKNNPPLNDAQQSASAPRKRRRRAPTTGAADDCFACQEAQTPCDRRRPYCSQCIERGKTCSGYKTQLTWGVGVASRGKLRGLSLPVVAQNSKKASIGDAKSPDAKTTKSAKPAKPSRLPSLSIDSTQTSSNSPSSSSSVFPTSASMHYDFHTSTSAPEPVQSPQPSQFTWTAASTAQPSMPSTIPQNPRKNARRHSLQPLQMPPPPSTTDFSPLPMTASVFGGYNGSRFESAVSDSPVTPSYQQYHEPIGIDKRYAMQPPWPTSAYQEDYQFSHQVGSWQSSDTMSSHMSSDRSTQDQQDHDSLYSDQSILRTLDTVLAERDNTGFHGEVFYTDGSYQDEPEEYEGDLDGLVLASGSLKRPYEEMSLSLPTQLSLPSIGKTRALGELIRYYDLVIAPVIVAFDSESNPFRTHILRLASESEALQHAIAALSASNLRMRRENEPRLPPPGQHTHLITDGTVDCETTHDVSVRNSSMAHSILRQKVDRQDALSPTGQHSQRELYHKRESIKALNAALTRMRERNSSGNGSGSEDDTVLATILVLCLYHICDTGVAKFRTQFAGVKKLMELRNKRSSSASSGRDSAWLLTMFKWFDAMTATVNDREGQFEDDEVEDFFDTASRGSEDWALENLAGCDARLFRVISKLGRLNLLSQGKPVRGAAGTTTPRPPKPPHLPQGMDPAGLAFDGNGWGNLMPMQQPYMFSSSPESHIHQAPHVSEDPAPSTHTPFGAEWWALRQELLDWRFDATTVPPAMLATRGGRPPSPPDQEDAHVRDLRHISEAFRHSALLYLERVAHPRQPSSAPGFRTLVDGAIAHIRAVKSDVYLLWPLFITGTECVEEPHRDLIRQRCRGIQSDSGFYNNTSTLTLLERIWADKDALGLDAYARDLDLAAEGPFKWRRAMQVGEEEYIVI